jgi:NADH-quinone oxidoreductase subunit K
MALIGAELLLNAGALLLVTANSLPAGGLAELAATPGADPGTAGVDPLLPGQVFTVFVVTIAAAEIGVALAVVLLLYRQRATSDLTAVRELGEASPTYSEAPGPDGPDGPGVTR